MKGVDPLYTVTREKMIEVLALKDERDAKIAQVPDGPDKEAAVQAIKDAYAPLIQPYL